MKLCERLNLIEYCLRRNILLFNIQALLIEFQFLLKSKCLASISLVRVVVVGSGNTKKYTEYS